MEALYLINTFIGFIIAQISDILTRDKKSSASPKKFSVLFFIKDTWQKILLSLILSYAITFAVYLNLSDVAVFAESNLYGNLIYIAVGAVPEWILQKIKKKYGFTQPTKVKVSGEEFYRKENNKNAAT